MNKNSNKITEIRNHKKVKNWLKSFEVIMALISKYKSCMKTLNVLDHYHGNNIKITKSIIKYTLIFYVHPKVLVVFPYTSKMY